MRVVLVSWSEDTAEAVEHLRTLADAVDVQTDADELAANPPDAVVVDLGQRPDEGLDVAIRLPGVPHVFVNGTASEVNRVRATLPDARFTDWEGIGTILRTALERPS